MFAFVWEISWFGLPFNDTVYFKYIKKLIVTIIKEETFVIYTKRSVVSRMIFAKKLI